MTNAPITGVLESPRDYLSSQTIRLVISIVQTKPKRDKRDQCKILLFWLRTKGKGECFFCDCWFHSVLCLIYKKSDLNLIVKVFSSRQNKLIAIHHFTMFFFYNLFISFDNNYYAHVRKVAPPTSTPIDFNSCESCLKIKKKLIASFMNKLNRPQKLPQG